MVVIQESPAGTDFEISGKTACLALALALMAAAGVARATDREETGFAPIYALLQVHCGACHVRGVADGPWSLNTPPSAERFPACLTQPADTALVCATYHELVDPPGPGIPAWIRPTAAGASEPYAQACDPEVSFHIGHSMPERMPDPDCDRFLRWIEAGAPR